jgi:hypothetical protein
METPADGLRSPRGNGPLLLLALGVVLVFLTILLDATQGHFVPPVVDLYVVCQYARSLAEGHLFQYNPGDAPTTGATSLLHTVLLALAHAVGFRGEGLVAFAVLAGAALYLASVRLAVSLGQRLAGHREGLLGGALIALGGPVVWGFLYGSDIALFQFLALATLHGLVRTWQGEGNWALLVPATLLALARPEGLPLAVVLCAALAATGRVRGVRDTVRALLPVGAGLAVLGLNRALTGLWLGTSVADKSLLANYGLPDALALVADYGVDVMRGLLLGFYPGTAAIGFARGFASVSFPPLGLLLVVLAVIEARPPLATPLRLWLGLVAGLFLLVGPNMFMGVHFNRYLLWAFPSLLVLAAVGLSRLAWLLAAEDPDRERRVFAAGAALLLLLGGFSTLRVATLYGSMAGDVYRRDFALAQWIVQATKGGTIPAGARIATVSTGIEYLTGHPGLNLHGVTSPEFLGNRTVEREAQTFEALGRLPVEQRPELLTASLSSVESLLTVRELVEEPPLFRTSSFADDLAVYRLRWDLVGRNRRLFDPAVQEAVKGLTLVDEINVCDSRDEASHAYRYASRLGDLRLAGVPRLDAYAASGERVLDAGRPILGHETFRVRTRADRDLLVVLRIAPAADAAVFSSGRSGVFGLAFPEAGLVVDSRGTVLARSSFKPGPGWSELTLRIPGRFLEEGNTELTLSGRYPSFHYWFFQ